MLRFAPLLLGLLFAPSPSPAESLVPPTIGGLSLESCPAAAPEGWCGRIERPLDPADPAAGSVSIGFEWYPARTSLAPTGTVVAIQGGPGFSTTAARDVFRAALDGAAVQRNLLLFDLRGTGTSGLIVCDGAQQAMRLFDPDAAADCARQLGATAGYYGTVAAADDLAALLDRMGLDRVDLYGVSYGTVFEQVFALRHSERVRTMVLDSALAIDDDLFERGTAGWFAFTRGLDAVCKRDTACRPGRLRDDMLALWAALEAGGPTGISPRALSDTFMSAGYDGIAYRELGAALSSWRRGDPALLDRLVASTERSLGLAEIPPEIGSAAAFLAVSCTDMPMPFDIAADPATRRRQAEANIDAILAAAPASMPATEADLADARDLATFCVDWPAPPASVVAATALRADGPYPDIPVLVLSGDLDTVTPPALGAKVAGRFAHGIHLVVRNGLHGTVGSAAWMVPDRTDPAAGCVARIIARFITVEKADAVDCLADRPALRMAAPPPRRLADVGPAEAVSGTPAEVDLRIAAAIAGTVGDALTRFGRAHDDGLRGGTTTLYTSEGGFVIALKDVRWVEDLTLSGSIRLDSAAGIVTGSFGVTAPDGVTGTLSVGWVARDPAPAAMVTGTLKGGPLGRREIYARLPAP